MEHMQFMLILKMKLVLLFSEDLIISEVQAFFKKYQFSLCIVLFLGTAKEN